MCDRHPMLFVPVDGPPVEIPAGVDVASFLESREHRRSAQTGQGAGARGGHTGPTTSERTPQPSPFGRAA